MFELFNRDAKIIFAGDSITARGRWEEFFRDQDVLNRGIGSDITEGLYYRIDEVISHHPEKVFIMVGINDIGQNIPLEESIEFYEKIIDKIIVGLPECEIFIQSVLPVTTIELSPIYAFNEELKKLSWKYNIDYIDLFSSFLIDGNVNNSLLSADGVHLNGIGYAVWIDLIRNLL